MRANWKKLCKKQREEIAYLRECVSRALELSNAAKVIRLLSKAIERVTVNTAVEQGQIGVNEVLNILGEVETALKEVEG